VNAFLDLIDRLNAAAAEHRSQLERQIWDAYQRDKAVLALDMSGFSLSVRRSGILACLCRIRRMQQLTAPVLADFRGELVKYDADNLLAVFDDAQDAVQAAIAMNRVVCASAPPAGDAAPLALGIGIDYGRVLLVSAKDCFGDAVNIAHKLGEDIAEAGEILVTQAVRSRLGEPAPYRLAAVALSVCGLEIPAYRVLYARQ
jgi:class 3 adenylate cyclase